MINFIFRSFCGNSKINFSRKMCGFPPSFPRKRESIFTDKFPHSLRFFAKKIRENSKLSRKIRENSKINLLE